MLNEEVKLTNVQTRFNPIIQHLDPDFKRKEKPTAELWMKIYLPWKMDGGVVENSCPEKFFTLWIDSSYICSRETELNLRWRKSTEFWLLGEWDLIKKHASVWRTGDRSGKMRSCLTFRDGQLALRFVLCDSQIPFQYKDDESSVPGKERGSGNELDMAMTHWTQSKGGREVFIASNQVLGLLRPMCCYKDSKTMSNRWGELRPGHRFWLRWRWGDEGLCIFFNLKGSMF